MMTNAISDVISIASTTTNGRRFKITIESRGSEYSRTLYDVRGRAMIDEAGNPLNVYGQNLKDEFDSGRVRLIHNLRDNYRYFITNQSDMDIFQDYRKNGAPHPDFVFVIYPDEDFDPYNLNRQFSAFFDFRGDIDALQPLYRQPFGLHRRRRTGFP